MKNTTTAYNGQVGEPKTTYVLQLEAENAALRGRLFSLTCRECGDDLKSLYCPSCGRPMAQVVGQEYPSYAALRARVEELEAENTELRISYKRQLEESITLRKILG